MPTFTTLTARVVPLPVADIDTDRIIPARFLKTTGKADLGAHLFADWPELALDRSARRGPQVLAAGPNFGCGSSREHAVWALLDAGVRAVLAPSFADIFRGNALKNGLLPVEVAAAAHARLLAAVAADPAVTVTIDLATQTLLLPDGEAVTFPIDPFAKRCLLDGTDPLGYLLRFGAEIAAWERAHD